MKEKHRRGDPLPERDWVVPTLIVAKHFPFWMPAFALSPAAGAKPSRPSALSREIQAPRGATRRVALGVTHASRPSRTAQAPVRRRDGNGCVLRDRAAVCFSSPCTRVYRPTRGHTGTPTHTLTSPWFPLSLPFSPAFLSSGWGAYVAWRFASAWLTSARMPNQPWPRCRRNSLDRPQPERQVRR